KMGLPFGYSKCTRGGGGRPPHCPQWFSIQNPEPPRPKPAEQATAPGASAPPKGTQTPFGQWPLSGFAPDRPAVAPAPPPKQLGLAASFGQYTQAVADAVHSGSGRTDASDSNTDYYPVPLGQ